MKTFFLLFTFLVLFIPCIHAQGIQPEHFLWIGGGMSGYDNSTPMAVTGYGQRVGDGLYLLTDLILKTTASSINVSAIKHIVESGPVELFALGEIGIMAGNDVTKANYGVGGGLSLDILKPISQKMENFRVIGAVKLTKPDPGDTATVKPQFYGGLAYYLK